MSLTSLNIETETEARAVAAMLHVTSLLGGGGNWTQVETMLKSESDFIGSQTLKGTLGNAGATLQSAFDYLSDFFNTAFGWAARSASYVGREAGKILNFENVESMWTRFSTEFSALFESFRNVILRTGTPEDHAKVFKYAKIGGAVTIVGLTSYGVFKFYAYLNSPKVSGDPLLKEQREKFYKVFDDQLRTAKSMKGRKMTKKEREIVQNISKAARTVEKKSIRRRSMSGGANEAELAIENDFVESSVSSLVGGKIRKSTQEGLRAWIKACKEKNHGRIPEKGTASYSLVKRRMDEILNR